MPGLISTSLEALYLLAPAGLANIAPVLANKANLFASLSRPVDGGSGLLGANKTVRGFLVGIFAGALTGFAQYLLADNDFLQMLSLVNYHSLFFAVAFGASLGFAALIGDALKSLIKRRLSIPSGHPWPPFDQIDFALAALIWAWPWADLTVAHTILGTLLIGLLSFLMSFIGVTLHIKRSL